MRFVVWLLLLATPLVADELTLRISPRWRNDAITVPSGELSTTGGQSLRITRLAAIVSGVTLLRPDGSVVQLDGQYGFVDAADGRMSVTLQNVPGGDYAGIEFQFGLPDEINHADPARWPAGHPLNPLVNRLHWGWQGGFVFLALEGRWRAAGAAAAERGFSYHLATDAHRMPVRFITNFKVDRATTADFAFDLARVLGRRELAAGSASETTHSAANDPLAGELATATERAFFWLEASPTRTTFASVGGALRPDGMTESGHKAPSTKALATTGTPRPFVVPAGFPQPTLPADNPLTVEGVTLGRRLFHDPQLSGNGTQSCASCHDPMRAFSDRVPLSRGADGQPSARNAQPLVNLAWHPAYAWDGSQPRIRDQALAAMTNPVEMHADAAKIAARLAGQERIRADFAAAFGSPEITPARIGLALEQFLLAQVSADSKFDRALRGEATLTDDERRGFDLFLTEYDPARGKRGADCFHCHGGPLFSDFAYKNNGLASRGVDHGREKVTASADDADKFKTPSLRNVAVTGPYMHDGRFRTLEEVVAHYDHGVQRTTTLDPNLAKHPDNGLLLSADEQRAIVAFLRTLTDSRFDGRTPPPPGLLPPPPPQSIATTNDARPQSSAGL